MATQASQVNIRSEITRLRGVPNPARMSGGSDQVGAATPGGFSSNPDIGGPVPVSQLLANALGVLQDFANNLSNRLSTVIDQVAAIGNVSAAAGTVRFLNCSMNVRVDQAANQLIFSVRYTDGTVKTGVVALT